jgi:hypothetical protein
MRDCRSLDLDLMPPSALHFSLCHCTLFSFLSLCHCTLFSFLSLCHCTLFCFSFKCSPALVLPVHQPSTVLAVTGDQSVTTRWRALLHGTLTHTILCARAWDAMLPYIFSTCMGPLTRTLFSTCMGPLTHTLFFTCMGPLTHTLFHMHGSTNPHTFAHAWVH